MRTPASKWLLHSAGALLAVSLVACGGPSDNDSGVDSGRADVADAGNHDAQTPDAQPDAGSDASVDAPEDVAQDTTDAAADVLDAGTDAAADASDGGVDVAIDAAVDAPADTSVDARSDTGVDVAVDVAVDAPVDVAVDAPVDVAVDAPVDVAVDVPADVSGDVSCADGGLVCGGTCVSGGTLAQIDVTSLFNEDIILNNGSGTYDPTNDSIDGSNYVAITQSVATALLGSSGVGLPDNGLFAANTDHPAVQLAYNNNDNGNNARRVLPGTTVTIDVPDRPYAQLQVFAFSTEGSSPMTFTLHYCDGTTDTRTVTFPDWYNDSPPAFPTGIFYLINGLDRANNTTPPTGEYAHDPAAFGYSLSPNTAKVVTSVDVLLSSTSTARFHLLGATGQ